LPGENPINLDSRSNLTKSAQKIGLLHFTGWPLK